MSVAAYFTKMKALWDEIHAISPLPQCRCTGCKCDFQKELRELREKEQLYDFLMGLDDVFSTVKTHILSTKPTPSLGHAYHLVAEDEQQRNISASRRPIVEAAAFQTIREAGERKFKRDKPKCGHCQKMGHTQERCYEIVGYPPSWGKPGANRNNF